MWKLCLFIQPIDHLKLNHDEILLTLLLTLVLIAYDFSFLQVLLCGGRRQHASVCDCDTLRRSFRVETHAAGAAGGGQWRGIR